MWISAKLVKRTARRIDSRNAIPIIYDASVEFEIGKAHIEAA